MHSNKISKRTVLEELKRTRDGQLRPARGDLSVIQRLDDASISLNDFAGRLHRPLEPSGLSPQSVLGLLARTQQSSALSGYGLNTADGWDRAAVKARRLLVEELAARLHALGPVPQNLWRGVRCDALDPMEREALGQRIAALADVQRQATEHARLATDMLGAPPLQTVSDLGKSLAFLALTPLPAGVDRAALASPIWSVDNLDNIRRLIEAGRKQAASTAAVEGKFNETGQRADYAEIRTALVTKGRSLFRFLDGNYRRQLALLRSYVTQPLPAPQEQRLALVDAIIAAQAARTAFAAAQSDGAAFGDAWKKERSDWNRLDDILAWRARHSSLPAGVWSSLAAAPDMTAIDTARVGLESALPDIDARLGALVGELDLDLKRAFGGKRDCSPCPRLHSRAACGVGR